jgi:hypothetical protein
LHRHLVSESRLREGYKNRLAIGGDEPKLNQHSSDEDEDEDGDVEGEVLVTNDGAGRIVDDRFDRQYDEEQKEIQQLVDEIQQNFNKHHSQFDIEKIQEQVKLEAEL